MNRRVLRTGAVMGAITVSMLAIAPVFAAAAPVAQSSANAIELTLLNQPISSGTQKATHDGTSETKTGETQPLVGVLGNQNLLQQGVLSQKATTKIVNGDGISEACAALAGQGSSVVQVGAANCVAPGANPANITLAALDLTDVITIDPNSALGALAAANPLLAGVLGQVTAPLSAALSDALGGLTGITGSLGVVESHCTAAPGTATGDSNIANIRLGLNVLGTQVNLLDFNPTGAKNEDLLVNLDTIVPALVAGLTDSIDETLGDLGSDPVLGPIVTPIVNQIAAAVLAPIASALGPVLSDNILKVVFNVQPNTPADVADVTALHLELLPAAQQFGLTPLNLDVAHVKCGPNDRVAATPTPDPVPTDEPTPDVPTVVDSGMAGDSNNTARDVLAATAALMLLAGTAGLIGYRRSLTK